MFPMPVIKVSIKPLPNIGNILEKEKLSILAKNKNNTVIIASGIINEVALKDAWKDRQFTIVIAIMKNRITKVTLVIGK